jgi:hypothetical protein
VKISRLCLVVCSVLSMLVFVAGCPSGGPATVPVEGTLTIDGKPANDVTIDLIPSDPAGSVASGRAENGSFRLFTGATGTPGAVVGKYKVVLNSTATGGASMYQPQEGGADRSGSAAPEVKLPFPEKYRHAKTSDKEVEITSGSNTLKIEIP